MTLPISGGPGAQGLSERVPRMRLRGPSYYDRSGIRRRSLRAILRKIAKVLEDIDGCEEDVALAVEMQEALRALVNAPPPRDDRWAGQSAAFRDEHPWCGWTLVRLRGV